MIDWEDAFSLEGLASGMRDDPDSQERRGPRTLALLQRRGLLDFELEGEDVMDPDVVDDDGPPFDVLPSD